MIFDQQKSFLLMNKAALLSHLPVPIQLIHVKDFGQSVIDYCKQIKPFYYDLPWDLYLLRQLKLEYFSSLESVKHSHLLTPVFKQRYYLGDLNDKEVTSILLPDELKTLQRIKPTRRRAIAYYRGSLQQGVFHLAPLSQQRYHQNGKNLNTEDYRSNERVFEDAPPQMLGSGLEQLIESVLYHLYESMQSDKFCDGCEIQITTHFTQILCYPDQMASNSPEGIHQDGQDYIVSALVVERENVQGGESHVFGSDRATRLLTTTLYPGEGLMHVDDRSDLWHFVTPIQSADNCYTGYRSSIGFDLMIKQ